MSLKQIKGYWKILYEIQYGGPSMPTACESNEKETPNGYSAIQDALNDWWMGL